MVKDLMNQIRERLALEDCLESGEGSAVSFEEIAETTEPAEDRGNHQSFPMILEKQDSNHCVREKYSNLRPFSSEMRNRGGSTLLLFSIEDNRCQQLMSPHTKLIAPCIPKSRMETTLPVFVQMAVQQILQDDRRHMTNEMNPQKSSLFVSVYSFQLYGNTTRPAPFGSAGPFLSYLTEDDDIKSVKLRLGSITGDSVDEVSKYRLAFIKDRAPHFLENVDESGSGMEVSPPSIFEQAVT